MGSLNCASNDKQKEWKVLVTGFGPFLDNQVNPSFLIADSLPAQYSPPHAPPIDIQPFATPVAVRYDTVRHLIPKLLFRSDDTIHASPNVSQHQHSSPNSRSITSTAHTDAKYDLILHIGMASPRKYYTLESRAHRDGYEKPDVDGVSLKDDTIWRDEYNAPDILHPTFDTVDVWRRWKSGLMEEDVRPSDDAGHYLCDFTYYASMLEYWRREPDGRRPCMFLHVPGGIGEEELLRGRRVALGLIAAMVQSELSKSEGAKVSGKDLTNRDSVAE